VLDIKQCRKRSEPSHHTPNFCIEFEPLSYCIHQRFLWALSTLFFALKSWIGKVDKTKIDKNYSVEEYVIGFQREKKMVSEDTEKIIALVIVTLSFLSLPVLLFIFVITLFINVTYAIDFYNTRNFTAGLMAASLAIVNFGLFLLLRFLIRWIRK
jgi:hypothetical protein